ncbi:hypothetical protein P4V86_08550 [Brevibacillus laterosporus]|uniref:hypothetical protein n=1 Tax=Brevibacillus laterosporus TaxID=1465 RepID=UPI0003667D47|nr:hypothetical protein [Brevibacillus laterosporus]ATO48436.1 hypothetical protein BrL25_04535 [Brevibacillus laterosporus DSM 25]MBG9771775.1 hypothetical protein [Brevibacillus laterosporus]MBG9802308.1 hypothetical protein [Brevibacillus laterosporus]MED2003394.1 hypothetical protein [Brevibacillus laterosporus]MED4764492.1 hypothetical protein [Brevibacillus laterosporus]
MQLECNTLVGMVQPLWYVEKTLLEQGFRRNKNQDSPTYNAMIYDSSTGMTYYLRIPTRHTGLKEIKDEEMIKIGSPYLKIKMASRTSREGLLIPRAIKAAAEHKLAEIADYLSKPYQEAAQ